MCDLRRWAFFAFVSLGCAAPERAAPPPPHVDEWLAKIDWNAAGLEASRVLQDYLRIDTSNPPGNEEAGARQLAAVLSASGISSELIALEPGRAALVARLEAEFPDGSGPLCLLSHIDVASAEAGQWPDGKGPFSGTLDENGMIWGRGALDMKGMGALETMTLVWLRRLGIPLKRSVILLAVPDEEVGNRGMRMLVEKHWERLKCAHLINEGGTGIRDVLIEGQTIFAISVGEKGLLWTRMSARGEAGHGSTPVPGRAPERLLHAMNAISTREASPRIHPALYELLRNVGAHRGGFVGAALSHPEWLAPLVKWQLMRSPVTRATITDTVQITGMEHALQPNVVPSQMTATLDCRLLPGTKPQEMLDELMALVGNDAGITFEVLHGEEANDSPWDDAVYQALARHAVAGRDDAVAGPVVSVGYTDSILARPLGVRAYGFVPFEVTQEEAATMHGRNERVSVDNIRRGLRILLGAVLEVAGSGP